MAAFQVVDPASGDAVVLLANAQSIPYEVFSKVDMIGFGALDQMLGRQPDGTLEKFYPIVDLVLVIGLAMMIRGMFQLAGRVRQGGHPASHSRVRRLVGVAFHGYLDLIVPILLLLRVPVAFAAPWPILVRTDVGLVILIFAIVRLATGTLRLAGWWRSGRLPAWATVDREVPRVAVAGYACEP